MELTELLNFEERLEESFKEYLLKNGCENVYSSYQTDELKDERIDVRIEIGAADSQNYNGYGNQQNPSPEQNVINGSLIITVYTDQSEDKSIPSGFRSRHAYRKALLRSLFLNSALNGFISGIQEYNPPLGYSFDQGKIFKTGEQADVMPEPNVDYFFSELYYSFKFTVNFGQ